MAGSRLGRLARSLTARGPSGGDAEGGLTGSREAGSEHGLWGHDRQVPDCPTGWELKPPDFVGIGAPRAGTSWWFRDALQHHPRVVTAPGRDKEIHFFDRFAAEAVDPDLAERYARFFPRPRGCIAGEWTPDYMYSPWNLSLLETAAPEARFLIMLRDPVERFRSEVSPALRGLAESGLNALTSLSVGNCIFHSAYEMPVRRAIEAFGRDRVLILQYERCQREPLSEIRRTQRFLGLDEVASLPPGLEVRERSQQRIFPSEKFELPTWTDEHLVAALTGDVRDLVDLCPNEIDVDLWPNFRHAF